MGIDTKSLQFKEVKDGIIEIIVPKIELISLEIPYDQIEVNKEKGLLRKNMTEDELKNFYKTIEKQLRKELIEDDVILQQAEIHSEKVVEELVKNIVDFEYIVFE